MRRILVLFSVASLGARGALAEPRALTLAEAVEMARHNAVSVVRAEGTSENAAQGVRTARGALLPTLSLSTGSTRQYVPAAVPWSSNLALTTNLLLFDGGRRFFDLHQARATRASADVDEGLARWQAVLAAKQAFFDVLAARETQVAAAAQLEQADRQRWVAVERTRAKAATRSDSLRAEIDVRSAQLEVLVAATDRASADAALARAIGSLDPVTAAAADTTDPGLALDESALIPLVENAPLVQSARGHLDADREAEKGSWTAYLPSLSASWTHSGNGTVGPGEWGANSLDYTGALRLSLNFTLFDQFRRESQVVQAGANVRVAEAELRDARLAARQQLTDGLGGYRTAAQRAASLAASVEAAVEDLRVQSERYAVGGSTLLDVLASQAQLDRARRDLIRARYDQRVAKAQLEALIGRDL
ncbi:MAG: TolC family protein [Candidatus Eisenbacteria bacterium]|uniref:TolC family protein n=1 Tax=Eiseniibacteriota bacterium TaxID=2212470 RepID=A0A538SZM8_UNCEI|nr:MAG: TolC family protein [Candidatus Eisenbacteria bacterium]